MLSFAAFRRLKSGKPDQRCVHIVLEAAGAELLSAQAKILLCTLEYAQAICTRFACLPTTLLQLFRPVLLSPEAKQIERSSDTRRSPESQTSLRLARLPGLKKLMMSLHHADNSQGLDSWFTPIWYCAGTKLPGARHSSADNSSAAMHCRVL